MIQTSKIDELDPHNHCFFDPDFPDLNSIRSIDDMAKFFQPFDQEGVRINSLFLAIDPNATFKTKPCRFIRSDILVPLIIVP